MRCFREIHYMTYQREEETKTCGFAKLSGSEEELWLEISLRNLPVGLNGEYPVEILSGAFQRTIGRILLHDGCGMFRKRYCEKGILAEGVGLTNWDRLRILLPDGEAATNRKKETVCPKQPQTAADSEDSAEYRTEQLTAAARHDGARPAVREVPKNGAVPVVREVPHDGDCPVAREVPKNSAVPNTREARSDSTASGVREIPNDSVSSDIGETRQKEAPQGKAELPVVPLEEKWSQLEAIYPHRRPFDDDREYLMIRPADFVLLAEASYRRANNSFMLHGYYSYQHLLLARVERKEGAVYYLGTPGYFWEREKQAAVLFGYESFEGPGEPAGEGDFGYYMMRVEL